MTAPLTPADALRWAADECERLAGEADTLDDAALIFREAAAALPEGQEAVATGTFACPICGKDTPHTHNRRGSYTPLERLADIQEFIADDFIANNSGSVLEYRGKLARVVDLTIRELAAEPPTATPPSPQGAVQGDDARKHKPEYCGWCHYDHAGGPLCNALGTTLRELPHVSTNKGDDAKAIEPVDVEFEFLVNDEWMGSASTLKEALSYAAQYLGEGPVTLNRLERYPVTFADLNEEADRE